MEIKGTQKELEEFYKRRNRKSKRFIDRFDKFSKKQINLFIFCSMITILIIINVFVINYTLQNNKNLLTVSECNSIVNSEVAEALMYNNNYGWYSFLLIYLPIIKLAIFFILLSWVLHGVGFRIIG